MLKQQDILGIYERFLLDGIKLIKKENKCYYYENNPLIIYAEYSGLCPYNDIIQAIFQYGVFK